jgi:hypothetical protein
MDSLVSRSLAMGYLWRAAIKRSYRWSAFSAVVDQYNSAAYDFVVAL